jgi:hypothetical protein
MMVEEFCREEGFPGEAEVGKPRQIYVGIHSH